jgi:hypothetical protein
MIIAEHTIGDVRVQSIEEETPFVYAMQNNQSFAAIVNRLIWLRYDVETLPFCRIQQHFHIQPSGNIMNYANSSGLTFCCIGDIDSTTFRPTTQSDNRVARNATSA